MEYFSCLWKKISRIVIVVIALFCVGSIMPEEVKADEGVDLRYKLECKHKTYGSESYTHLGYLRVYFDETQGYEPGVYLYLSFYDWTVKSNYSFSVYMDNALLLQGMCSNYPYNPVGSSYQYVVIPPEYFKELNRQHVITIYTMSPSGQIGDSVVNNITLYKPLIKNNTTVSAKQISGKKSVKLEWGEMTGAKKYSVYRSDNLNGRYEKIGETTSTNISDNEVKSGNKYYYYVEAKYVDYDILATNKTSVEVKKPELSIPKIKVKKKRKTLNIYWGIIPDSSKGIEIYMKEGKNKKYKKVNTTTNLKKNKNKKGAVGITASKKYLKKGKKYSFRARTYTYFNNEKIYGKWSKTVSIKG